MQQEIKCKHSAFDQKMWAKMTVHKERAAKGQSPLLCSCFRKPKPISEDELRGIRIQKKIQMLLEMHY